MLQYRNIEHNQYTMYESVQALEELRREILGSETVVTPERNPLDFATVATQTDDIPAAVSDRREGGRVGGRGIIA